MTELNHREETRHSLINALKTRIEWEMSNGVMGYDRNRVEPKPIDSAGDRNSDPENCPICDLNGAGHQRIAGEGDPNAQLVFVGYRPDLTDCSSISGAVGIMGAAADELLSKIVAAIGLDRKRVYVTNIVKCTAPNEQISAELLAKCVAETVEELSAIEPKIVVTMGPESTGALLNDGRFFDRSRGQFIPFQNYEVIPTFHPAYLLEQPQAKRAVWHDMLRVKAKLA